MEMRKEIERRSKKKCSARESRMKDVINKIRQIEEKKNRVLKKREWGQKITHREETQDSNEEETGEIKIEVEMKEEVRRKKKIKITYKIDNDRIERRIQYTDRSDRTTRQPVEIGRKQEKPRKEHTNVKRRPSSREMEPKPSTSRASEDLEQSSKALSICDEEDPWEPLKDNTTMDVSLSPIEDSEAEAKIGKTRPAKIKKMDRGKNIIKEQDTKTKKRQRKKFIIDQRRSEIAKKNYVFMKRDKRGRWAEKASEQLKSKPVVIIPRLTPDQIPDKQQQPSEEAGEQPEPQKKTKETEKTT